MSRSQYRAGDTASGACLGFLPSQLERQDIEAAGSCNLSRFIFVREGIGLHENSSGENRDFFESKVNVNRGKGGRDGICVCTFV